MDDPADMHESSIQDALSRLSKRLGMAPECGSASSHGRLKHKSTSRSKFCDMKPVCHDCKCVPPSQAKEPTELQSDNSISANKTTTKRDAAEIYGGFDKSMSRKKMKSSFC